LAQRSAADLADLRRLCSLFLATKEFHGADGFEVTDEVAVAVAAQACLPVLRLGLSWYDGFVGIVMHAGEVVARRRFEDEHGIVHEY
ncbi:zinc-dependent peptidase, partial [Acinetobacter baumannii]